MLNILKTAAENDGKTKLCVIFKVADEIAEQFPKDRAKPDGSPSKMPPHCTLLYTELEPGQRTMARNLIRQVAGKTAPFQVRLSGKGTFPNCVWSGVKGVAPGKMHEQMLLTLRNAGIEAPQTHDSYKPHCTVAYSDDPENWKGVMPRGSFWVREIEVWFGGERRDHVYKLGTRLRK